MNEFRITHIKVGVNRPKAPAAPKLSGGTPQRGNWKIVAMTSLEAGRIAIAWEWHDYDY